MYMLFPSNTVIDVNINNMSITEINEDNVFLLYPFKKNWIIILIIIDITSVGMVGLNPQPIIITRINSSAKLKYILRKVFIPLFPPIIRSNARRIIVSTFIICLSSYTLILLYILI